MFSLSDESNISIFYCFYIIIFIVTINFYRVLKSKGKTDELHAFPCVALLVKFHFVALIVPLVALLVVGILSFVFSSLTQHFIVYTPAFLSLLYHDTMADWMVPLILIYSFTLSYDFPETFHFRYIKIPRDTLIWITMITYGFLFNSVNPWDIVTIRRIHTSGHFSTSFNFVDAFLVLISILFVCFHGYRMSLSIAFRDNRFHITLLFLLIKLIFLLTAACFLPTLPDHFSDSDAHRFTLDNLKLYESVVQSAVPLHYLAWKHLFFKNV